MLLTVTMPLSAVTDKGLRLPILLAAIKSVMRCAVSSLVMVGSSVTPVFVTKITVFSFLPNTAGARLPTIRSAPFVTHLVRALASKFSVSAAKPTAKSVGRAFLTSARMSGFFTKVRVSDSFPGVFFIFCGATSAVFQSQTAATPAKISASWVSFSAAVCISSAVLTEITRTPAGAVNAVGPEISTVSHPACMRLRASA